MVSKDEFKRDDAYGYQVSLKDNRDYMPGHQIGFTADDTDVTALQKILDAYIDTTSTDSMGEFASYKLEFALLFLDTICISLIKKIEKISKEYNELEIQEEDISHLMTKPYLTGKTIPTYEKVKIYDMHENIVVARRNIKDTMVALRVMLENTEKARNFILGMNRRHYSAKSSKFRDDPRFKIEPKEGV